MVRLCTAYLPSLGLAELTVMGVLAIGGLELSCSGSSSQVDSQENAADSIQVMSSDSAQTDTVVSIKDTPASDSLSQDEWQKLDHALKLLLRNGPGNPFFTYQRRTRDDGGTAYGVLIRTPDPSALAESSLPLGSPSSEIVTAQLTTEEIRRAVQLEAVVSVSNPSEAKLH